MSSDPTATDPDGVVHRIDGNMTRCGIPAIGWSRAITELQLLGLVIFCGPCHE